MCAGGCVVVAFFWGKGLVLAWIAMRRLHIFICLFLSLLVLLLVFFFWPNLSCGHCFRVVLVEKGVVGVGGILYLVFSFLFSFVSRFFSFFFLEFFLFLLGRARGYYLMLYCFGPCCNVLPTDYFCCMFLFFTIIFIWCFYWDGRGSFLTCFSIFFLFFLLIFFFRRGEGLLFDAFCFGPCSNVLPTDYFCCTFLFIFIWVFYWDWGYRYLQTHTRHQPTLICLHVFESVAHTHNLRSCLGVRAFLWYVLF